MARLERHYGDGSDNPAWVSLEGGAERYLPGLGSDLGVQMTTIPVGAGDTVMGVSAWSDYTEYGTRYLLGAPAPWGLVAGPGMTDFPCRSHDPGGVVALPGGPVMTADRDLAPI